MKTRVLFIVALLIGLVSYGQDYNKWSISAGIGNHNVNDASFSKNTSVTLDSHWDLGVRYNLNPTFGVMLNYGRNVTRGNSFEFGLPTDPFYVPSQYFKLTLQRLSLEASVDLFDVAHLYSKRFTILGHGGVGVADLDGRTEGIMTGGLTGLFKVSNRIAIRADYSVASAIDQKRTIDGMFRANAEGITSNVHSGSLGITMYLGKRKKTPPDFWQPEPCDCGSDTIINNEYITNKTYVTKVTKEEYTPIIREYVFFDHDKEDVRGSELNAIYQIYVAMMEDSKRKVVIIGSASDTKSSSAYNLALSERRCNEVKSKLMDMGIDSSRITTDPIGKDYVLSKETVHDTARRVELLVRE